MDFLAELETLLRQIPPGHFARVADVARALGDVRASAAIARVLRDHPEIPNARRVVAGSGPAARGPFFNAFRGGPLLAELRAEQIELATKVSRRNGFRSVRTVGGVDVSYEGDRGFATLVVLRASDLTVVEEVRVTQPVSFPYIPTYLAYREWPLIEAAAARLRERPTVLLVDGHGQLHPARCGIACLVGIRLGVPTIGVAKHPLVGSIRGSLEPGGGAPVVVDGEVLGYAMRTSQSTKPLFVSTGHRVATRTAVRIVRALCRTRQPEPLRIAHVLATEMKRRQRKKVQEGLKLAPFPRSERPKAKGRGA